MYIKFYEKFGQKAISLVSGNRPDEIECLSEYIFLISNKNTKKRRRQKAKETKEEKRISVQNPAGYEDIVSECALCTFILQQHMKYTLSKTKIK